MTSQSNFPEAHLPDAAAMSEAFSQIVEHGGHILAEAANKAGSGGKVSSDPLHIGDVALAAARSVMADPFRMLAAQTDLWFDCGRLWRNTARRLLGDAPLPVIVPDKGDRRFTNADWTEVAALDNVKQLYLLWSRFLTDSIGDAKTLDPHMARKVQFYTRQMIDTLAPTNSPLTNPEVLRATVESGGLNLVRGFQHMLEDMDRGHGRMSPKMTDFDAFQVGRNIATTPGKVVYQNDLMQLVQYTPTTADVNKRPLLIVPPWINKFYILDLREKNSFIKWAVDQGHTVFVISWVNPDERFAAKSFEDYMLEGPLDALDQIEKATGERSINAVGYCLGGTLLASTLAYLSRKDGGKDKDRIASATFFTTMTDFSDVGEMSVFIDEEQITSIEADMAEKGYLDGSAMASSFNMLRANDLIWSFVVSSYLLGKEPLPFDLLYWNSDNTRMPAAMHSFYLRNMYQKNLLAKPDSVTLAGEPIDLRRIETPCFFLSAREDHIAPWKSTYAATQVFSGPVKFVLSASGHIAGVVNPPAANKYCYWTGADLPAAPDAWLEKAARTEGSWWPEWNAWVGGYGEGKVAARQPGAGSLPVLEDAPGSYVAARPA
ncbi:MAG TPA: class I poly(R)-hydroxyalkanoic acid synthase [Skermanella sp.]|nr:class I poly(R)-hydroxyalkanoic acid synthase [Skermanella sp.]